MKFKLVETLFKNDIELAPGLTFQDLMDAALDDDGDFVLNPLGEDDDTVIDLPEDKWNTLYDAMFNTDEDTLYSAEEYRNSIKIEKAFDKRYNCVTAEEVVD